MTSARLRWSPKQIAGVLLRLRRLVSHFPLLFLMTIALSTPLGFLSSYLAMEHNPQGTFCAYVARGGIGNAISWNEPCVIRWLPLTMVFFSWFVAQIVILVLARSAWRALRGIQ